ncbi:unnamed protein product [Cladocopium goreaui]|uniref:DUF7869 domain-containing protein n=1 Tax=Cladocopium goreaui TaxID=2562237 RepID=A0A9P1G8D7_9DINO|nr:unnamed protein product [Cladocopium goreaui]
MKAASEGKTVPPLDLRYLARNNEHTAQKDQTRGDVASFLHQLFHSCAETLPDVRDDPLSLQEEVDLADLEAKNGEPDLDPYAQKLAAVASGREVLPAREEKVVKKRKLRKGVRMAIRFSHLRFRSRSQHGECSTCIRHKAMVRRLAGHLTARNLQQQYYFEHLQHQYADRLCYWSARGESRHKGLSVVMITDGMDQAKYALPRSEIMKSKEFGQFQRPRLHISALIAHGWFIIFQVSPADLPKDSNSCIELISHSLTILKRKGAPLKEMHVNVQSDNTCRECKNSLMLRYMAALVSSNVVGSAAPTRGFYVAAVPVAVKGMFGPGAPHVFLLQRRCDAGPHVRPLFSLSNIFHKPMQDFLPKKSGMHIGRTAPHILEMLSSGRLVSCQIERFFFFDHGALKSL